MLSSYITGIISFFLPPIIDVINLKVANSKAKYWIALVVSTILGLATSFALGEFDTTNVLSSIGASFIVAQTFYKTYWANSGIRKTIRK